MQSERQMLAALLRASRINTRLLLMVLGGEERIEMDLAQVEALVDAATALIVHMEENHTVDELEDLNLQSKLTNLKAAVDAAATPATPADGGDTTVDLPAEPPLPGEQPVTGAAGPVDETTPGE